MNYLNEIKLFTGYCGSYCRLCDWHTGKIRRNFQDALKIWEEYTGFPKQTRDKFDPENFKQGLEYLSSMSLCSGCKEEIEGEGDRCKIRLCAHKKGLELCCECAGYQQCQTLTQTPGVIKFGCLGNLQEINFDGAQSWIDRQWEEFIKIKDKR
jgi:hypothetical protein